MNREPTIEAVALLSRLGERISQCMVGDRRRLRVALKRLRAAVRQNRPHDRALARIEDEINASVAKRERRAALKPVIAWPADLPIVERRDDIASAVRNRQVVIVCGETGSGKSTQLPKICLDVGRGIDGLIAHTQPRRIAARSIAARIAQELNSPVGRFVGHAVRFDDVVGPDAFIKVMTDGLLLAETQRDPLLRRYDTIIIDEAHERSLNIDFLLGYVHRILPRRPDLKLIITSATIDPQRFSDRFDGAPIIEVTGRTYPVDIRHAIEAGHSPEQDENQIESIVRAVQDVMREPSSEHGRNDVLIFLSGERDIRDAARAIRPHVPPGVEILPLYARLSAREQQRVFQPPAGGRRIILATNVAETSLTVPGIRFVIDPGQARISRYSARSKVQRLPIEPISRASADQRAGRCGRVQAGVCVRLYSEEDYKGREMFTPPEILRSNLAAVILQMKAMGLGEIESFPFLDAPRPSAIRDGYDTLYEIGAVDAHGEITPQGRRLARLPADPRIARILVAGEEEGCLRDVLVLAAVMSIQDPRERPLERAEIADTAHAPFRHPSSDFLTLLNIWHAFHDWARETGSGALRRMCRAAFLSYSRMREWQDVHHQLQEQVREIGLSVTRPVRGRHAKAGPNTSGSPTPQPPPSREGEKRTSNQHGGATDDPRADAIHRAILSGLISHVAMRKEGPVYESAQGAACYIFPGSSLFAACPPWIVAAEMVETTKLYMRTIAPIRPEWVERLAGHLVKRAHVEPHWDAAHGRVMAFERVTLNGLELAAKRRVHYGPINPVLAREMFIHHALVVGDYRSGAEFLQHNRRLVDEIQDMEARTRRRDLLADPESRHAFYDALLPADVYTGRQFEKWAAHAQRGDAQRLRMSRDMLLRPGAEPAAHERFPDHLLIGSAKLPLSYSLAPGAPDDGVTVTVPHGLVSLLSARQLDWLVPGMLRERITHLLRGLPKEVRQQLAPLNEFVTENLGDLEQAGGSLVDAMSRMVTKRTGARVETDTWSAIELPPHLRMNIRVIDDAGRTVLETRDVAAARSVQPQSTPQTPMCEPSPFDRRGITEWDFGDLPVSVTTSHGGVAVTMHPAIEDEGGSVRLCLLANRDAAGATTRRGLRRLFAIRCAEELRHHLQALPDLDHMCLDYSTIGKAAQLQDDLCLVACERAFQLGGMGVSHVSAPLPRTAEAFEQRLDAGWPKLWDALNESAALASRILREHQSISLNLMREPPPPEAWKEAFDDIALQLERLAQPGFLSSTPPEWLAHVPRYLAGIRLRMEKLANGSAERDRKAMREVNELWAAYERRMGATRAGGGSTAALDDARWLFEELRVSLFAQELGTAHKVSVARLQRMLER